MLGPSDAGKKAGKAMGEMEVTLSDLQDEVAIAKEPPRNHFKPSGLLLMVIVAALVGGSTFLAVDRLTRNSRAIKDSCEIRNDALALVNEKFGQLEFLFDLAIEAKLPEDRPSSEVLRALAEFKKPIALIDCAAPL